MKNLSMPARLAATGAATALAAASLVAAGSVSANAATGANDYRCILPGLVDATFPVTVDTTALPPAAPAGFGVPADAFSLTSTITIPAEVAGMLAIYEVDGATAPDFGLEAGNAFAPAPLTVTEMAPQEDGSVIATAAGTSEAFFTPNAGTHAITMPTEFEFIPSADGEDLAVSVVCTTAAPATLAEGDNPASITTTKQASTMDAKAARAKIKRTAKAKLIATVTRELGGAPATGRVIAKKGAKKVGSGALQQGKATFTIDKLKVGKHTITLSYKGDGATTGSKDKVTIKVVK